MLRGLYKVLHGEAWPHVEPIWVSLHLRWLANAAAAAHLS